MLSLVCPFLEMTLVPERGKLASPFDFFLSLFLSSLRIQIKS